MSHITAYWLKIFQCVLAQLNYLFLHIVIIVNYVHNTYSSFAETHSIILYVPHCLNLFLYVETLADSNLFKCLISIKCLEKQVETIFFIKSFIILFSSTFYS